MSEELILQILDENIVSAFSDVGLSLVLIALLAWHMWICRECKASQKKDNAEEEPD